MRHWAGGSRGGKVASPAFLLSIAQILLISWKCQRICLSAFGFAVVVQAAIGMHSGRPAPDNRRPVRSLPAGRCRRQARTTRQPGRGCPLPRPSAGGFGNCLDQRQRGLLGVVAASMHWCRHRGWGNSNLRTATRGEAIVRTSSAVRLGISVGRTRTLVAPRATA